MSTRHEPEKLQKKLLEELYETTHLSVFEMFRNFPVFTPRFNIARFLAHYELFKKVVELPGVIIDLGVYRGASTFTWAKLCEIFCPTDVRKVVYGFDTFEGFPSLSKEDGFENVEQDLRPGGYFGGVSIERDLDLAKQAMNHDRHLRHLNRIELIKGNIIDTIPEFVASRGNGLKVALLNFDLDLYEPTKVALEYFVPQMIQSGIIILDEYAVDTFGGESKAVDEYFQEKFGKKPTIRKFTWQLSSSPLSHPS